MSKKGLLSIFIFFFGFIAFFSLSVSPAHAIQKSAYGRIFYTDPGGTKIYLNGVQIHVGAAWGQQLVNSWSPGNYLPDANRTNWFDGQVRPASSDRMPMGAAQECTIDPNTGAEDCTDCELLDRPMDGDNFFKPITPGAGWWSTITGCGGPGDKGELKRPDWDGWRPYVGSGSGFACNGNVTVDVPAMDTSSWPPEVPTSGKFKCFDYFYTDLDGNNVNACQRGTGANGNDMYYFAQGDVNNYLLYDNLDFNWVPDVVPLKSCNISPGNTTIAAGQTATFSYDGTSPYSGADTVRVYLQRQDGGQIGGNYDPQTNARIDPDNCSTSNGNTCYSLATTDSTLPPGNYYLNCQIGGTNLCTGNPLCGTDPGAQNLYTDGVCVTQGWRSCSDNDSATLTVVACPATPTGLTPNGTLSCLATTTTISWDNMPNAQWYDVRVDDGNGYTDSAQGPVANNCGPVPHDVCINQWGSNSMTLTNLLPGRTYSWWVHASAPYCSPSPAAVTSFTVPECPTPTPTPIPQPPTNLQLKVGQGQNATTHNPPSDYKISGKLSTEQGQNYKNDMKVILDATPGSYQITDFQFAFYRKSKGLATLMRNPTNLSDPNSVVAKVQNPRDGMILRSIPIYNQYQYWDSIQGWVDFTTELPIPNSQAPLYTIKPGPGYDSQGNPKQNLWYVKFHESFNTDNLYLAGYALALDGQYLFVGDIDPSAP